MGAARPLTFGPEEMSALKAIVLAGDFDLVGGGSYDFVADFRKIYLDDLTRDKRISRKLKVVAACGNGTAGAFAPEALERIGCEVIPLDVELDHRFPNYNPNPEDMKMLHAIRDKVLETGADVGLGFDGDGDRCGVVDNEGNEIFADKVGVMLARDIARLHPGSTFVVDVKSTGLFNTDAALRADGAVTDYWKTGHSYIKRRVAELGAIAGFEKSGHFFFNPPIGRGYDDGLITAIAICEMLDRSPTSSMADLYRDLPLTFGTPTMSPHCADDLKYGVVERVVSDFQAMKHDGAIFAGQKIAELITVNGVRVVAEDGTWGLVRASSNKPELVVVVESPVSSERRRQMFEAVDAVLRRSPEVGAYNQTF
jgi:phosphomannomutase/phosphoglucomutase